MGLSPSKSILREKWQELLLSLNFQKNVMFYHRTHGEKWQRKELYPGQSCSCHRALRHSSSGLAVTQQAPDSELKEISLTPKELCRGSAEPIPLPALRRLRQLHMIFLADRPDPGPVYSCMALVSSFSPSPGLFSASSSSDSDSHQPGEGCKTIQETAVFGIFNYIFFVPGFKKNTLAFLKVSDKRTTNLHLNLTQTFFL